MTRARLRKRALGKSWCGPVAVTVITGKSYEQANAALTGRRAIMGSNAMQVCAAIRLLRPDLETGWGPSVHQDVCWSADGTPRRKPLYPTFAAWCRRTARPAGTFFIVVLTGHFVVVRGRTCWDQKVPEGVTIGKAPWRRARVRMAVPIYRKGAKA